MEIENIPGSPLTVNCVDNCIPVLGIGPGHCLTY